MEACLSIVASAATIVDFIISLIVLIWESKKRRERKEGAHPEAWTLDREPSNLHERHIVRRSLIGDAFQDAGKMKNIDSIQVYGSIAFCFLAVIFIVADALGPAFFDEEGASIAKIALMVAALICVLFSLYFLICLLFKVTRIKDIPQRSIGMFFTLRSKRTGSYLALSNIERLVGNYSNCLIVHADKRGIGDSFSLFGSRLYSSDDLQSLFIDDDASTVFLVYSMYGKSSCLTAEQLSKVHANVYDLGGIRYSFSYYDRQARMIEYLKEANLLKEYEPRLSAA